MDSVGTLYVVATPLGNLEDFSPRAVRTLKEVDLIACEDTRHTRKLLNHLGITTPTTSYHEHNEEQKAAELVSRLKEGKRVALVSDAGTPLVSDPGYRLVKNCREERIPVVPIPGPSAAVAALSVSGLPTDRFFFAGFLPRRAGAARQELERLAPLDATLVFYLSPHGLLSTLQRVAAALGNRTAFLMREMTKVYETSYYGTLEGIMQALHKTAPRGEYTLIVEGIPSAGVGERETPNILEYVKELMETRNLSRKEAIKAAARELGLPKRDVYKAVANESRESRE